VGWDSIRRCISKNLKSLKGLKSLNFLGTGWSRFFKFGVACTFIAAEIEGPDPAPVGDTLFVCGDALRLSGGSSPGFSHRGPAQSPALEIFSMTLTPFSVSSIALLGRRYAWHALQVRVARALLSFA
jgi:hypothetical protein